MLLKEVYVNQPNVNINQKDRSDTSKNKYLPKNKINTPHMLLLGLIYTVMALYLPVSLFSELDSALLQTISLVLVVVTVAVYLRATKALPHPVSRMISTAIAVIIFGTVMSGVAVSFVGAACILAYVLIYSDKAIYKIFIFLPPVAAYIAYMLISGSPLLAIAAVFHIPAALTLAYVCNAGINKVSAICRVSAALLLSLSAIAVSLFVLRYGADPSAVVPLIDDIRANITGTAAGTLYAVYRELGAELSLTTATEIASAAVNSIFNLLPAILIIAANLVSFLLHTVMTSIFVCCEQTDERIKTMRLFDMSIVSAIVFLVTFFLAFILSAEKMSVWSVTAENISAILIPGLVLTSFSLGRMYLAKKKGSCLSFVLYVLLIMSFVYIPTVMLPIAAVVGAIMIILNYITLSKIKKISGGGNFKKNDK